MHFNPVSRRFLSIFWCYLAHDGDIEFTLSFHHQIQWLQVWTTKTFCTTDITHLVLHMYILNRNFSSLYIWWVQSKKNSVYNLHKALNALGTGFTVACLTQGCQCFSLVTLTRKTLCSWTWQHGPTLFQSWHEQFNLIFIRPQLHERKIIFLIAMDNLS